MIPALQPLAKAAATSEGSAIRRHLQPARMGAGILAASASKVAVTEYPFVLKPIEAWREHITVISGLDATSSMPPAGMAGGDHSRSAAVFSGVPPKKTVSDDIYLGTTIDQMIAQKHGQDNALPSIQLGIEDQSSLATCPWGYSCAYVNSVSWSGPTKPLPHEANPQVVFERLFGDGGNAQERMARRQAKASLLDAVTQEVNRLNNKLPGTDRARLDEYLEDIREIERRLHNVRKASDPSPDARGALRNAGIVQRTHQVDVGPADAGVPGGHHARVDADVRARRQHAQSIRNRA